MSHRRKAFAHFKEVDPKLYKAALPFSNKLPARLAEIKSRDRLFNALARSVISQQLGGPAANTIALRLVEVCGGKITSKTIEKVSPARLRGAGLSGAKAKTLKALASAVNKKQLDLLHLRTLEREEAEKRLTAVWGVGPWTAEMFLMFALGHADIFSAGDLGLIRSMESLYNIKKLSRERASRIAKKWSPHRTYACLALWSIRDKK